MTVSCVHMDFCFSSAGRPWAHSLASSRLSPLYVWITGWSMSVRFGQSSGSPPLCASRRAISTWVRAIANIVSLRALWLAILWRTRRQRRSPALPRGIVFEEILRKICWGAIIYSRILLSNRPRNLHRSAQPHVRGSNLLLDEVAGYIAGRSEAPMKAWTQRKKVSTLTPCRLRLNICVEC